MADEVKTINYGGRKNRQRISEDEKELQEMLKARSTEPDPEEEEEVSTSTEEPKEDEKGKEQVSELDDTDDENLSAEEKTFKKRYGDARRYIEKLKKELKEKEENPTVDSLPVTEEELAEFRKEHPGVYSRVEAIATMIAERMIGEQETRFKKLEEMEEESRKEKAYQEIKKSHPDFGKLRNSDEFHEWADKQPKWVQDALYENEDDARSVIRVIDLYKVDNGMTPTQKKEKQKEALRDVKTGKTTPDDGASGKERVFSESEIRKMSDREFEENMEEINKAKRSGRIIYDLSQKSA